MYGVEDGKRTSPNRAFDVITNVNPLEGKKTGEMMKSQTPGKNKRVANLADPLMTHLKSLFIPSQHGN